MCVWWYFVLELVTFTHQKNVVSFFHQKLEKMGNGISVFLTIPTALKEKCPPYF